MAKSFDAMARVYVSLGSNVRAEANLQFAVRSLRQYFSPLLLSPVYRNAAVGFDGDDFLNMVAGFDSDMTPLALNELFDSLHTGAGRQRHVDGLASRTLDIDLLLYGQQVSAKPSLPRADVLGYNFVLQPLAEIAPQLVHPVTDRSLADHLRDYDASGHPLYRVELAFD